jgi:DNA-binding NarL/FixJ family response regulator
MNGLSNAEIARDLVISLSTTKFHVSRILTKLNVSSRTEAISLAMSEGLITPVHSNKTH